MIERFENRESEYLEWVHAHPEGYVANLDVPTTRPEYPMVHLASHKAVSSASRDNYTTGKYIKVCSLDLPELEQWSQATFGRKLARCSVCL
ncbi:MAG: hypothetical protein V4669_04790 [Pseudomonadota bacterium]